jgi:hypothetical protein
MRHHTHGHAWVDLMVSIRLQTSKRSNDSGSGAEQPAKRAKLMSGQTGPASLASTKRHTASAASSCTCSPTKASVAGAAGPLSGLHLVFWRLKHAKQLCEQVADDLDGSCRYAPLDSQWQFDVNTTHSSAAACDRRSGRVQWCRETSSQTQTTRSWSR